MPQIMARRSYIAYRDKQILKLLKVMSPKEIVAQMNLSSVWPVYEAVRLAKNAGKKIPREKHKSN